MNQRPLQARTTRVLSPGLLAVALILVTVLVVNGMPRLLELAGGSRAASGEVVAPAQTELVFVNATVPQASRPGTCAERSLFAPRDDAWRCVVGGATFDPCFEALPATGAAATAQPAIVCGAEPLSGATGFVVRGALPPTRPNDAGARIPPATLESLTYSIDLVPAPVTLTRGQFYLPWVDATGGSVLVGLSELRAEGDLDRDGDIDLAVLLVADAADDRMFIYLGAVINENGSAVATATIPLGDRIKVDNIEIRNGQIIANMTTHTGDDPDCCPTLDVEYHYTLAGDRLNQVTDGWRLEMAGGSQCLPVQSQTAGGGMPFAYQCSDGTWLRNGLRPGQVWHAVPAGALRAGGQEGAAGASVASGAAEAQGAFSTGAGAGTPTGAAQPPLELVPIVRIWQ
jgi:hypothetical protein